MLSHHRDIGTVNETHLFSGYLGSVAPAWARFPSNPRAVGLHHYLDETEFFGLLREFTDAILGRLRVASAGGDRAVFLEKTPDHVRQWKLLSTLYPKARFLHVVRDPRAVVASLRRAGQTWGAHWADTGAVANARRWLIDVDHGLAAEASLGERCRRIQYEHLWEVTAGELSELFSWIGVNGDATTAQACIDACAPGQGAPEGSEAAWDPGGEPMGFFGIRGDKGWQARLTYGEVAAVDWICRERMAELGYSSRHQERRKPWLVRKAELLRYVEWRATRSLSRT